MKLDLHIHSRHSPDGEATPRQILKHARKIGLGGLCVSDHNTVAGSTEARKIAGEFGLVVVSGIEISSSGGHILGYGIHDEVPRDLTPEETVERIREQGGMAVVAHPYRYWSGLGEKATRALAPDGIEAVNSHSTVQDNAKAGKLASGMGLPRTAGSDAHELREIGGAFVVMADASTEDDVLKALRAGEARAGGRSRYLAGTLKDRTETVVKWMGRGFRKM